MLSPVCRDGFTGSRNVEEIFDGAFSWISRYAPPGMYQHLGKNELKWHYDWLSHTVGNDWKWENTKALGTDHESIFLGLSYRFRQRLLGRKRRDGMKASLPLCCTFRMAELLMPRITLTRQAFIKRSASNCQSSATMQRVLSNSRKERNRPRHHALKKT